MKLGVVIPAHNEEQCVALSIANCRAALESLADLRIVVCDNASSDRTADCARTAGAEVVREERRGYGFACLAAMHTLGDWPNVILFCDADATTPPSDISKLARAMQDTTIDLCIGARRDVAAGSMSLPQRFGNALATGLIRALWGRAYFDLGPTRAIRLDALKRIDMRDTTWGWTVEMQIKAVVLGMNVVEIPVAWQARPAGESKISGTISGVLRAGFKILWTVASLFFASTCGRIKSPPPSTQEHP
ncbi:MAG: glycosyltransferase family 2 protein [Planctomycetota bacterium]